MIHAGAAAAKLQAAGGVRSLAFDATAPLQLSSGETLAPLTIAFETYGALNIERSNAVLVCHALMGDQFVASPNPITGRPAWWPRIVGPGRPIDTNRFFVICSNVLGGSMGSTGPGTIAPDGLPYSLRLPAVTMADAVRAQAMLVEALGIENLFLVIGPGMGGMQALQWASAYPKRVFSCVTVATAPKQSAQNVALAELGRQAIMADPDWRNGAYLQHGVRPTRGGSVARTSVQLAGLSAQDVRSRFETSRTHERFAFNAEGANDTMRQQQGAGYVDRFDANSYLYLSRAMDGFDLAADFGGRLANAFQGSTTRHGVFSFSSDWRYPPDEGRAIARALAAAGAEASFLEITSAHGHDAYMGHEPAFEAALTGFVDFSGRRTWLSAQWRRRMMAQLELVHPSPLELTSAEPRGDHLVISRMVSDSARILDVGCGVGALMQLLVRECGANVRGLEIDPNKAHRCVVRGLSVVQGDAERDLGEFPSGAFDYVVFSHTLQHFRRPQAALKQAARIGQKVIVSISNAGRWDKRTQMLMKGRLGPSEHLQRYTVRDFADLAREMRFSIERAVPLSRGHAGAPFAKTIWRANWFCEEAVFLLTP